MPDQNKQPRPNEGEKDPEPWTPVVNDEGATQSKKGADGNDTHHRKDRSQKK